MHEDKFWPRTRVVVVEDEDEDGGRVGGTRDKSQG